MRARVIDGKAVAAKVRDEVRTGAAAFADQHGRPPGLATVLVGEDEASHIYVRNKRKACEEVGIRSVHNELPATASQQELIALIEELNGDDSVDGVLVQLPLPEGLDADAVVESIAPAKDVDGLTADNAGRLARGEPRLVPCTPAGVMELLREENVDPEGLEAVIVGRSNLVGRPLAALLLAANATVTICHSRTRDLAETCRRADLLIAAVGVAGLIQGEMVKPGATVIDVGMNRSDDGLAGDADYEAVSEVAGAITPVPGGVGPMTIAMLLSNTLEAATRRASERD